MIRRLFLGAALALAAITAPQVDVRLDSLEMPQLQVRYAEAQALGTTNVACSATNVQVVASNGSRRNLVVFNDADQAMDLKYGTTASTSSYTVQIPSQGYWEMAPMPIFTQRIDAIWESACTGSARVTEQ